MLSSQTKDHVTASAMTRLQNHGLTVESIYGTSQEKIEEMIRPVGFYRVCFDFITLQARGAEDFSHPQHPPP